MIRRRSRATVTLMFVAALVVAVSGCSSGDRLDSTRWKLTGWSVSALDPADFTITAEFADGQVGGSSGVNSYGAPYSSGPGDALEVGEITSTLIAGPDDAMQAESTYIELLRQARSYTVSGDTLTLFDEGGNESLIFEAAVD